MRVLGTLLLSLVNTIVALFAVVIALDEDPAAALGLAGRSRVGTFAAAGLAAARREDVSILRPVPTAIGPDDRPIPTRLAQFAPPAVAPASTPATKSAWVAPIVRRAPPAPVEAAAAPAGDDVVPTIVSPPKPVLRRPLPSALDGETRSALGGPMEPLAVVKAAPKAPLARKAPAAAPSLPPGS